MHQTFTVKHCFKTTQIYLVHVDNMVEVYIKKKKSRYSLRPQALQTAQSGSILSTGIIGFALAFQRWNSNQHQSFPVQNSVLFEVLA